VKRIKVLQIAAVDVTVRHLLLPLIDRLIAEGFDVHTVCSDGRYVKELREKGYAITAINIARKIAPVSNIKSLVSIYMFLKKERFDIIHVHSPVASVLGRIAARLAGSPVIIYTAHGFYFHENMSAWKRQLIVLVEKLTGRLCTDMLFTQSHEDRDTAVKKGIMPAKKVEWISNGIEVDRFPANAPDEGLKRSLGISPEDRIIGFTGRLVREKGIGELVQALNRLKKDIAGLKLLVIGDTLESDRDKSAKKWINDMITENGLENDIVLAGFREDLARFYGIMDVFVLPSYREGMPRSILEAMAAGRPVVATNIRGCREEVIDGVTGRLVPVKDSASLAEAIKEILSNKELAIKMGRTAMEVARENFNEKAVLDKEVRVYRELIDEKITTGSSEKSV